MFARRLAARTLSTIAALTCSTALAVAPLAAQTNLVTNGGFETGDLTGWFPEAGVCGTTTGLAIYTGAAHSGTSSLQITSTPFCDSWAVQPMTLIAGHTYQVDFWAMILGDDPTGPSNQNAVDEQFSNIGGNGVASLRTSSGWFHVPHLTMPAPTDTTTFKIGAYNIYGSVLIDDVSIVDVTTTPEPSSLALLGTGLFGLVPMLKRRRR